VQTSTTPWWQGLTPSRSSTVAGWLLAVTPLLTLGALAGALWVALTAPAWVVPAAVGVVLIALVLPIVLVAIDRAALRSLGWPTSPKAGFLALGWFSYLLHRQLTLRGDGARGVALTVATVLVSVIAVLAVGYLLWTQGEQLRGWMLLLKLRYL
jgi:hypothetical protein